MINKIRTILTVCLFVFVSSKAQEFNCRTKEQNDVIFKKNPKAFKEWNDFNIYSKSQEAAKIKNLRNKATNKAEAAYTIPVVFHVYGNIQSGKTVTYEKLVTVLNEVNKDFNGLNDDYNTVESFFQPRRSTLNIEFKLAKIDPNGNCTNGVVFYPAKSGYGNGGGYDNQIAADAWDNKKYINVYIQNDLYNDGSLNNSGVAWYPNNSMTAANTARIVFNGAYIFGNTDKEFASTMTHEFGHFFNLIHTFEGGCADGDQVTDTPAEDGLHTLSCTPGTNCNGQKVNIENYLGYNGARGCYKMFTQGQVARMLTALQHPARITLWQPANLTATGVNTTGVALSTTNSIFKENTTNDGSLSGNSIIALEGTKTFSLSSGTFTKDVHYTISNLPKGLTPLVAVNNNKQLTLTFSGNATSHQANNSGTMSVNFLSAAFTGGSSDVRCTGLTIKTKFIDPYGIFFVDMTDATVRGSNNWKFFTTSFGDNKDYGAWRYAANHLKFETYGKRLVCQSGTRNISLLPAGTIINSSSNFTAPGAYPNQLDLRSTSYKSWDGQTGYVGYEYEIDGAKCYGWFKVTTDANGDGFTVLEYAYNTQPGDSIIAGSSSPPTTINAPSNLTATVNSNATSVTLNWTDNATNETGFTIEKSSNNGTYIALATLATNSNTYSDNAVSTGNNYAYRVRAFNSSANSSYSNVASVTLTSTTTLPTPTRVTANGIYAEGFYITWDLVTNATSYEVQLFTNGAWVNAGTSTTYYFWIGKQGSTLSYTFRVRAKNATSVSNWSPQNNVTIPSAGPKNTEISDSAKAFIFSPNPTADMIYIENHSETNFKVEVYNTNGVLIDKFENQINYSTRHLNSGIYILKFINGDTIETKKLIKK